MRPLIAILLAALLFAPAPRANAQSTAAPTITSVGPFSVNEGVTAIATLTATDSDTAAVDLVWTKTGGADSEKFELTTGGTLTFAAAKDYENPDDADADGSYEITVQVSDGTNADMADLLVVVENVIELQATITGPATVSFAENTAARVATYSASSDEDRDGVTWTISGTDADHFTINSLSGALRFHIDPVAPSLFVAPPDFEDPDDANDDNTYELTLKAAVGSDEISSSVTVTVTDTDEVGAITLSSQKPKLGTELTATVSDPDGITAGTATWQWERNDGREGWLEIAGADSASYTPTAADGDRYLRVRATYTDGFGSSKTAETMAPHVVIAHRLSALTVSGLTGVTRDNRAIYPNFDADTLHYAARCTESITLTLTTEGSGTRLSVNGVQRPKEEAFTVDGLGRESDIRITLTGTAGASTTYTVHCIDRGEFPKLTTVKAAGATEDLLMFRANWRLGNQWRTALVMMDNNGVPRLRRWVNDQVSAYFRVYADGTHPRARYAFTKVGSSFAQHGFEMVVLDKYFNTVDDDIHILRPFNTTDGHDQLILPNGDYVLMAYSVDRRDLRFLNAAFPDLRNESGNPLESNQQVQHSAIQVRTAGGTVRLNWNSWDYMAIEDCIYSGTFNSEYGHINSLGLVDGDIIAGFRHCSKILRIDLDTGDVVWRTGPSIHTREQWEAGETLQQDRGPAPLDFINDPRGGFSGQHGGHITVDGNLLVYDNATHCSEPPGVPSGAKGLTQCHTRTRAVEYAIDSLNNELVFLSEFQMPETDPPKTVGGFAGHAEPMDNGDWMISWSNPIQSGAPMPNTAMQVDPRTGTEKLRMTFQNIAGNRGVNEPRHARVVLVSPVALAPRVETLSASFPASSSTSVFHTGAADTPQVVVAFNRPVIDFAATSASLSVTGGTVASVSAHVVDGEPANAYLVTLTPAGDGAITFQLLTGRTCAEGGICTADGTTLTNSPAALVIGPPVTVSFGQASYSVREGSTRSVTVQLSSAHQGVRAVTIPVVLDTTAGASAADLTADTSVTFAAGETTKTLAVEALDDDLVEGEESATLEFGTLPHGVTAGSTDTATVTVTDADLAQFSSALAQQQASEGGEVALNFTITNGVTFEDDQTVELSLGGSATPEDDFTLVDESNQTLTAPYELTFPAGASSASVTVRVVDDSEIEHEAETVTLRGTLASTGAAVGATQTLTIPPSDVPDTPEVSIAAGSTVTEGEAATFTLTRTASTSIPFSSPLTVSLTASGRGSSLGAGPPTTARFEAGNAVVDVLVPTLDDRVVEPAGAVTLLIRGSTSNPPVYLTLGVNAATVAVNDNDVAAFTLSVDAEEVAEGNALRVTVSGDGVTFAEAQTLDLTLAGTATPGDDFTLAAHGDELSDPYAVALPAGAASVAVTVQTARDGVDDVGETIEMSVGHNGNAVGAVTITIGAPPPAPVPVFLGGGGGGPSGPTPSQEDFEWTVKHDIEALDSDHDTPTGMWSDGAVLWLLHNPDGAGDAVYAYDLESGERVEAREFELDDANRAPRGVWSDGETIWISDSGRDKLFAHDLASGERLSDRDVVLHEDNANARGIWSVEGVMWVLDSSRADTLFAYNLESGELLGKYALDSTNRDPHGLWSDGVTIWVSDHGEKDLLAYQLPAVGDSDGPVEEKLKRVRGEDFTNLSRASNNSPRGIWSDGDVMYVADASDGKVYTYNMPDAIDARLTSLTLSGIEIGEFSPDRTEYEGVIGEGVTETVVIAEAMQRRTTVVIDPSEAGAAAAGHRVALAGTSEITVTVTSADGSRSKVYRVVLGEPEPEPWPHCLRGAIDEGFSLVVYEGGSLEDLAACARSRGVVALYALHEGAYLLYVPGEPEFVNQAFRELYAGGVPPFTALVAASNGPPSDNSVGDIGAPGSWPECLRGEVSEGFSLVVYEGGSVEDLSACSRSLNVSALYALANGEWVPYIPGAPDFVNAAFGELFPGGLPPATPLVGASEGLP